MVNRLTPHSLVAIFLAFLLVAAGMVAFAPAPSADAQTSQPFYREATLSAANVITADEQSAQSRGWAPASLIAFGITCTEDSGTASLDVTLQKSIDGGTTWSTVVAMTQLTATGAETKLYADLRAASAQLIGDRLRVNFDVTGTGQYTCSAYLTGEG